MAIGEDAQVDQGHPAPCRDVVENADVIFHAKALDTHGANTEMAILGVLKGNVTAKKVIFKHAVPPLEVSKGSIYIVYAKKTSQSNVYSELWGTNYCEDSVNLVAAAQ